MPTPPPVSITWTPEHGWDLKLLQPTVKAGRIADLLTLGGNTFSSTSADANLWGSWPADYTAASVIAAIKYLVGTSGLPFRLREYHYAAFRVWQEPWCELVHAATGARFTICIGAGGGVADAQSIVAMAARSVAGTGWLEFVEGVNEPNTNFGSGTVPADLVVAAQAVLGPVGAIAGPHPIRVLGPSIVFGLPHPGGWITPGYFNAAQMASIKANSSLANAHVYPPDQVDVDDGSGNGALGDVVADLTKVYGQPIVDTEVHPSLYNMFSRVNDQGKTEYPRRLDPVLDAYYAACLLLSSYRRGIVASYWYALMDYGWDDGNPRFTGDPPRPAGPVFASGLFPKTGGVSPRPAAATLRAMFALTGDPGATRLTFETGSLEYSIDNPLVEHDLFQNSIGVFFLFLRPKAQSLVDGPTTPFTVSFAKPRSRVRAYKVTAPVTPTLVQQDRSNTTSMAMFLSGSVQLLVIS